MQNDVGEFVLWSRTFPSFLRSGKLLRRCISAYSSLESIIINKICVHFYDLLVSEAVVSIFIYKFNESTNQSNQREVHDGSYQRGRCQKDL